MDGQDMEMMEGAQAVDRDPTWEVTRGSQSLNRTYEGIDTGNDSTAEVSECFKRTIVWLRVATEKLVSQIVRTGPKRDKQMKYFEDAFEDLRCNFDSLVEETVKWRGLGIPLKETQEIISHWSKLSLVLKVPNSQIVDEVHELFDRCTLSEEVIAQACRVAGVGDTGQGRPDANLLMNKLMEHFQVVGDSSIPDNGIIEAHRSHFNPEESSGEIMEYHRVTRKPKSHSSVVIPSIGDVSKNNTNGTVCDRFQEASGSQDVEMKTTEKSNQEMGDHTHTENSRNLGWSTHRMNDKIDFEKARFHPNVGNVSNPVKDRGNGGFVDRAQSLGLLNSMDDFSGTKDGFSLDNFVKGFLMRFPRDVWSEHELVWLFSEKVKSTAKDYFDQLTENEKQSFDTMIAALKVKLQGQYAMNRVQASMKFNCLKFENKSTTFSKFILTFEKLAEQTNPELPLVVRKKGMANRLYDIMMSSGYQGMKELTKIVMDGEGNEYDRMKASALNEELMEQASKITIRSSNEETLVGTTNVDTRRPGFQTKGFGLTRMDQCTYCGKSGHWKRDCWTRQRDQADNRTNQGYTGNSPIRQGGFQGSNRYNESYPRSIGNQNGLLGQRFNVNGSGHVVVPKHVTFNNRTGGNAQPLGQRVPSQTSPGGVDQNSQQQWGSRMVKIDTDTQLEQRKGVVSGSSPLVQVEIFGIRTIALVDSGAQVSTITKVFLDDMVKGGNVKPGDIVDVSHTKKGEIIDASGNAIGQLGLKKILIRLCATEIESEVVFYVVEYAPPGEPILLGTNALGALGVELMLRNDNGERLMIEMKERKESEPNMRQSEDLVVSKASDLYKVKVSSRVVIKPKEVKQVVLKVEGAHTQEVAMWSQDELRVASGLAKVDDEGNTVVLVHNTQDESVVLRENEEIGEWENMDAGSRWNRQVDDDSLDMLDLIGDRQELKGVQRVEKLKSVLGCDKLPDTVVHLIEKYESVFALYDSELGHTNLIEHDIDTGNSTPLKQKARPVPVGARAQFKKLMKGLLDRGIVEKSTSPWASPIVLVIKKDGTLRLCIDYRELNKRIKLDSFPLPRIDDMVQTLGGKQVFSSLDLHSGFWQIKLNKEAKEATAFTTTEGLYQFTVMPFGVATAPGVFQRMMALVLDGLSVEEGEVKAYIDDILISTDTVERHVVVMEEVLKALQKAGLCLKPSKCELLKDRVKYLGHVLTGKGVEADPDKVRAVLAFPKPKDVSELRSFLGLCGYYRKFVLGFSKIAKPLTVLTSKSVEFSWGSEQEEAFKKLKDVMVSAPVLTQPDFVAAQSGDNPFVLFTDACKEGVGAVLCQKGVDEFLHPLYFISKGLTKAEKNYSITDLEGLAVVHAVQRLQSMLYDMHFVVKTDHQPLTSFFKSGKNDRVMRWALALQSYGQKMKIEYLPGKENVVADALSRCRRSVDSVEITCVGQPENLLVGRLDNPHELENESEWLAELKDDEVYKEVIGCVSKEKTGTCKLPGIQKKLKLEDFLLSDGFLWYMTDDGNKKKVVPKRMREKLYEDAHGGIFAGHFSAKKVCEVLKKSYFWEGLSGDVAKWHQKCTKCYLVNAKGVNTPPLKPILTGKPFELVGVDLLDLGLIESGNKHALVLVDNFSKWMAAYPIRSKTADEVAETIVARWICDGGRWPKQFLSDMGSEFMNKVIEHVKKVMGIDWITTKGYNPRENGLVERANGTILRALKKKMTMGVEWDKILPFVVYSYNTTPHSSTGESPYFLLHGMDPPSVLACDVPEVSKYIADVDDYRTVLTESVRIAREMARECMEREMTRVKDYYDELHNVDAKWKPRVGDRVYVRKPENQVKSKLQIGFSGPMRVIDVSENSASVVELSGRREPVKLPFDWLLKVPMELRDDAIDDTYVRGKRGRPKKSRINRIIFSQKLFDMTIDLNFCCTDEATSTMIQTAVNGNVRGTRRGIGRGFRGGRGYRGHGPNRGPWRGGVVKNK